MATASIADQVIDFYSDLFEQLFSQPFRPLIRERLKQKAVERQIEESADAASQSLTRFFLNQQLKEGQVAKILAGYVALRNSLDLDRISNPNVTPESLVEELLQCCPVPGLVRRTKQESIYRVGLHSVLQVLMLVGPVMAEWKKLKFSSTFELPRRVVNRLNEISEQLDALGLAGESVADENYELTYRDYLLQRFHRVEAGTVRMTTSLNVDLRELFVMPRLKTRPVVEVDGKPHESAAVEFMGLAQARKLFTARATGSKEEMPSALDEARRCSRLVIIGAPGSGKSTFLEWLQLKVASVEEELVLAGQQAIPLLLRIRQLDPKGLPRGADLIERATASRDRAALMPPGWIDRQMRKGRILLMLDGLDETEPELRDRLILPWLHKLCEQYPACHYLVSSRPVGYPPGALRALGFVEADLRDFDEPEIAEYTRHWCTAIRLAQNEPEAEARKEGAAEGESILRSFRSHPYISNLARNPLMLSAICLVNYFERGKLPEDRAVLYRLCVEGLLHHWDQRRGIQSEFTLEEKLRSCREVALTMQADDRAEYPVERVKDVFAQALGDPGRAESLLEHVRYRTGLLLERRAGIFAFAHLTFQEYLAARGVHEGNHVGVDIPRLIREHGDARWREVIALYCGLVPLPTARKLLEDLLAQDDTPALPALLADAYLSGGPELAKDQAFRKKVIERIAALSVFEGRFLHQFSQVEVAPIANARLGKGKIGPAQQAIGWLRDNPSNIDWTYMESRIASWRETDALELGDLMYMAHANGPDSLLLRLGAEPDLYAAIGPTFTGSRYLSQAEVALAGFSDRGALPPKAPGFDAAFLQILRTLAERGIGTWSSIHFNSEAFKTERGHLYTPQNPRMWKEYVALARRIAELMSAQGESPMNRRASENLIAWADALEKKQASATRATNSKR